MPTDFSGAPSVVVIDLETPGAIDAIAGFKGAGRSVVAFGPHVKVNLLEAARAAGADQVLTRGQATRDLGPLVAQFEKGG